MKTMLNTTAAKLLLATLAATCLIAAAANAAPVYSGKFTLPGEVRWGKAVLPAGEYVLTLESPSLPALVCIRATNGKTSAFVMPVGISPSHTNRSSALIIARRGNQRIVQALRLAEQELVLRYVPQKPRDREADLEASAEQEVTLVAAKH